jgi:uncharacterized membrane protein YdjX (TVP38/TMEM64 family)
VNERRRRLAKAAVALAALVALLAFGREAAMVLPAFAGWVRSLGAWGPVVFVAGYGLAAVFLLPCFLLTLAAGALWGVVLGVLYVMLGVTLGSTLAFFVGRHLVRGLVQTYVDRHPRLAAIDRAVETEGLRLVFLLRLSPVVPFILLNYVLGISRIRFRDYLGGIVGMTPTVVLYVYAGRVAGDLASLGSGAALQRGPAYYVLLSFGLIATAAASLLVARAAQRAVNQNL